MAQTTNTKTMTRAERFMSVWIENNGYQYDNFPVGECMQSYADQQLKAKMPSEQEIEKAFGMMLTRTENDQNFDSGVKEGIKWLKQQITK